MVFFFAFGVLTLQRMNITPLALYLIMLAIAVLFALLVLEVVVFWLG
jgi:hypothetical protein